MIDICRISLDIIKAYLSDKEYLKPLSEENVTEIFTLLQKHDLGHIVGIVLKDNKNPILLRAQYVAAFRYEELNYEKERIFNVFEENSVKFIPLKGAVTEKWYYEPWHRTRSDIDILVSEADLKRASDVLVQNLNYTKRDKVGNHDLQMYSPKGAHLELHYDLSDTGISTEEAIKSATSLTDSLYIFSPEYFMLYHIAHMAKHFKHGGCGIRSLIDVFLIRNNLKIDKEKLDELFIKSNLKKFAYTIFELTEIWFCDKESNEFYDKLTEYIFFAGVYGTLKNRVLVEQAQEKGRAGYILQRIFIKSEILEFQYPVLKKHNWLMPFFQIVRWFDILTTKRFVKVKKELRANKGINNEQQQDIAYILNELGLLN